MQLLIVFRFLSNFSFLTLFGLVNLNKEKFVSKNVNDYIRLYFPAFVKKVKNHLQMRNFCGIFINEIRKKFILLHKYASFRICDLKVWAGTPMRSNKARTS